jgi:hypothetical protein
MSGWKGDENEVGRSKNESESQSRASCRRERVCSRINTASRAHAHMRKRTSTHAIDAHGTLARTHTNLLARHKTPRKHDKWVGKLPEIVRAQGQLNRSSPYRKKTGRGLELRRLRGCPAPERRMVA